MSSSNQSRGTKIPVYNKKEDVSKTTPIPKSGSSYKSDAIKKIEVQRNEKKEKDICVSIDEPSAKGVSLLLCNVSDGSSVSEKTIGPNADNLSEIGRKNVDNLSGICNKNVDNLSEIGSKIVDNLSEIGSKNVNNLSEIGPNVDNVSEIGPNVDNLSEIGNKNVDNLSKICQNVDQNVDSVSEICRKHVDYLSDCSDKSTMSNSLPVVDKIKVG